MPSLGVIHTETTELVYYVHVLRGSGAYDQNSFIYYVHP